MVHPESLTMPAERIRSSVDRRWRAAQAAGLVATLVLLVALVRWPEVALFALWNLLIPLVPASLLIAPDLWRNVCPLATLNTAANGLLGRRRLGNGWVVGTGAAGMVLLGVLVPARRFLLNTDGLALAVTVGLVGLVALTLGAVFDLKAGFCNAICPVLPVERLYGQRPFVRLGNPRCRPCTLCTQVGCIDLSPTKSIAQTLGPERRTTHWLRTPFGVFAAAFPGFVLGYFTLSDGTWAMAPAVYQHVALWSLVSFLTVAGAVQLWRLPAGRAMPTLAALAVGLYYWFTPAVIVPELGGGEAMVMSVRMLLLSLVVVWWFRATRRGPARELAL